MTGAELYQFLIIFGPDALGLAHTIAKNWKNEMPSDEVQAACSVSQKSIQDYAREARAKLQALGQLPVVVDEPTDPPQG